MTFSACTTSPSLSSGPRSPARAAACSRFTPATSVSRSAYTSVVLTPAPLSTVNRVVAWSVICGRPRSAPKPTPASSEPHQPVDTGGGDPPLLDLRQRRPGVDVRLRSLGDDEPVAVHTDHRQSG